MIRPAAEGKPRLLQPSRPKMFSRMMTPIGTPSSHSTMDRMVVFSSP